MRRRVERVRRPRHFPISTCRMITPLRCPKWSAGSRSADWRRLNYRKQSDDFSTSSGSTEKPPVLSYRPGTFRRKLPLPALSGPGWPSMEPAGQPPNPRRRAVPQAICRSPSRTREMARFAHPGADFPHFAQWPANVSPINVCGPLCGCRQTAGLSEYRLPICASMGFRQRRANPEGSSQPDIRIERSNPYAPENAPCWKSRDDPSLDGSFAHAPFRAKRHLREQRGLIQLDPSAERRRPLLGGPHVLPGAPPFAAKSDTAKGTRVQMLPDSP